MDMKRILQALFAAALSLALVACGTDEPEVVLPETTGELTGSFSIVNSDGTTFAMDNIRSDYEILDGTVDITLYEISFSPRMPMTLDMTIPGVKISQVSGGYSLSADSIVPLALGRPFEQYMVTDLTGTLTTTGLSLKMDIGGCPSEYKKATNK